MTCLECKKELSYLDHRKAIELFDVELCGVHRTRMERLIKSHKASAEAIILYYGLRRAGVRAMLAWWDGSKTVDLAVSRVKLNIEMDFEREPISFEQAIAELGESFYVYHDGFTTLRIPHFLVRSHLNETVEIILGIIAGLKSTLKVLNPNKESQWSPKSTLPNARIA